MKSAFLLFLMSGILAFSSSAFAASVNAQSPAKVLYSRLEPIALGDGDDVQQSYALPRLDCTWRNSRPAADYRCSFRGYDARIHTLRGDKARSLVTAVNAIKSPDVDCDERSCGFMLLQYVECSKSSPEGKATSYSCSVTGQGELAPKAKVNQCARLGASDANIKSMRASVNSSDSTNAGLSGAANGR